MVDGLCRRSFDLPPSIFDSDARFWTEFTGWQPQPGTMSEFRFLLRPESVSLRLLLQRLGDDDHGGGRLHVDLSSDDVPAEQARHVDLGAEVVWVAEHWTTLRDPVGLIYCITDRQPGR